MKNVFKRLLLGVLVLAAGIIGTAAAADRALGGDEPPVQRQYASVSECYYLRDWQGYIAVFRGEAEVPEELTDIKTDTLNTVDREKLSNGIRAEGRLELASLLEDLGS